jgi:uncharacterized phage-associated protein
MPYPASLIAYAFVKKGIDEGTPVTQMKLQKMVYFAHGVHLAVYGKPLVEEHFQAWKFGPVVREIYNTYKFYGSEPISDTNWLFFTSDYDSKLNNLDTQAKDTIELTWNTLKSLNAAQLSNWTHKAGSPWNKVFIDGVKDIDIPNEDIKEYFKQYLVK